MNTHAKGYAEKMPLFYAAIKEAVRANPDSRPPWTGTIEEYTRNVASLLAEGNCGLVVFWGGREMAKHLLPLIEQTEHYDSCLALHGAIKGGTCFYDNEGELGRDFNTQVFIDWLAGKAEASEEAVEVDPLPSVERICSLMEQAYKQHSQSLPPELFTPQYASWRLGSREAPTFEEFASQLHYGLAGGVVAQLGREFCRHVLISLEVIGAYDLCYVLRQAVENGVSNWDTIGYLPQESAETNLPDCDGSHTDLETL